MMKDLKTRAIRITLLSVVMILLSIGLGACKKNQLGGKGSIKGKVAHHGKAIPGATVYIKFNTQDFPGDDVSAYDAHVDADADGNYEFPNVYKGSYYLYGAGEDYSIPPPYTVAGGVPVKVRTKEKVSIDVPVTEN